MIILKMLNLERIESIRMHVDVDNQVSVFLNESHNDILQLDVGRVLFSNFNVSTALHRLLADGNIEQVC